MQYASGQARYGSKIAQVIHHIQRRTGQARAYYEPMVGGANVACHVAHRNKFLSDAQPELIAMWQALQEGWEPPTSLTKEEYLHIRDNQSSYPPEIVAFAGYGCSFGGKWFAGYARGTSRQGKVFDFARNTANQLQKQLPGLIDADFRCCDYRSISPGYGSFIYLHPPYSDAKPLPHHPVLDHAEFWEIAREWSRKSEVLVCELTYPDDFRPVRWIDTGSGGYMGKRGTGREEYLLLHESSDYWL